VAIKNQVSKEIENPKDEDGKYLPSVVLDLDYTVVIPKTKTKK
jgi:2-methylfumaryl-CoA hydratase